MMRSTNDWLMAAEGDVRHRRSLEEQEVGRADASCCQRHRIQLVYDWLLGPPNDTQVHKHVCFGGQRVTQ